VRHRTREKLAPRLPVHVTVRMLDAVESMRQPHLFKVVARAFWAAQGTFGMRLTHFSVQGKHLHLIVEGVDKPGLRRAMTGLNVRIARGLNRAMYSMGRCVKERYHTHILKTPGEVRQAIHYVLKNHEHHTGSKAPDPCSSVLNPQLVVEPQAWLLQHAFDPPIRKSQTQKRVHRSS
jgi:hypothetical protein